MHRAIKVALVFAAGISWTMPTMASPRSQAKSKHHATAPMGTVEGCGWATWYSAQPGGHNTASGVRFDPTAMAAAHVTAPMGTIIRVTIISTGQSITVSVVDREPMHPGRIVDLTPAAADILGIRKAGKVLVRVSLATKTDPP